MLIIVFLGILLVFLLIESIVTRRASDGQMVDNTVLTDQTLAYHLDWNAIRDQKLLQYLYVKKVNAIVRYQNLAGVDYEQANAAIEHLLAHPDLLPTVPHKRRPAMPSADDKRLQSLIATGRLNDAITLYTKLVDVDQFTAKQVIERMEREQYITSIADSDVQHLIERDRELQAVKILRKRYSLTANEAIHVIDSMMYQQIED